MKPKHVLRKLWNVIRGRPLVEIAPHEMGITRLEILECGADGDTPWIKLKSGHTFYGLPSGKHDLRKFEHLKKSLPPVLTPHAYHLAHDIQRRYYSRRPRGFPGPGSIIIEAGAYIGLKAIRFAETVAPNGRVIAIELMPENTSLMERNVRENNLQHIITSIHAGVWHEPGEYVARSIAFQRNSMVELDERNFPGRTVVPVDTLDNILDRHNVDTVDFMNMQVNGAEIEALQGLKKRIGSVKLIHIASHYHRDGKANSDTCCQILESLGCKVLSRNQGHLVASHENHAAEQTARLNAERANPTPFPHERTFNIEVLDRASNHAASSKSAV